MSARVFVDTNVLVYAHDTGADRKREIAAAILRELWETRAGRLSAQVLQEFYVNVTRKIPTPLGRREAREVIASYSPWEVTGVTAVDLVEASEIEERHKLSFWDALIVVAARKAGAAKILTEDMNHGQRIEGVQIENPFLAR